MKTPYKKSTGEWKTWKEFWKEFKQGMRDITQYQQTIVSQFGYIVTGIGLIWGIIFAVRLAYYWMVAVLIGGFIVLSVQYLANWQRKMAYKEGEDWMKKIQQQDEISETSRKTL